MKFVVSCRDNGLSKGYKVEEEHKWGQVIDMKVGNEMDGEKILGEAYKGYTLRISGGTDENGFPMKNGVLKKGRAKLLIPPGTCGLRFGRTGERKRRSVRGCIIDRDIGCVHLTIVTKGATEITGLTDVKTPRRLGPKRANKIRKLFGLPKHSDKIGSKDKTKVTVDRFDVCRYVVKRPSKTIGDKQFYKAPRIQRLVTSQRIRRKKEHKKAKRENISHNTEVFKTFVQKLKDAREQRLKKTEETAQPAPATTKTQAPPAKGQAQPAKGQAQATAPKTTAAPAKGQAQPAKAQAQTPAPKTTAAPATQAKGTTPTPKAKGGK
jgi:small subunit ribosomal protein S6e